jgi:NAD(P)-dependent dehydrogenase (short-subunit alcohol dehydrogenase family)
MTSGNTGTVLITGPTGGLGRALALELAGRADVRRPDLLLVGRPGERLKEVVDLVRGAGATAEGLGCDLSRLADVRGAAVMATDLITKGLVDGSQGGHASFSSWCAGLSGIRLGRRM